MSDLIIPAITVYQPWAWGIAYGGKGIENRGETFRYRYRGPLAIHAGKRDSERGRRDPRILHALRGVDEGRTREYGAIIAVASLVDIHDAEGCCKPWGDEQYVRPDSVVVGCRHLVLRDVRPVEIPVSCRGFQGMWNPPEDVQALLRAAA